MEPLQERSRLETPFGRAEFDVTSTAVLVVDMQNDCVSPDGLFAHGGIDISPIQAVVKPIAQVLAAARRTGLKVVYLRMGYQPDLSDTGAPDGPNWSKVHGPIGVGETVVLPDGSTGRFLIRDTWGTEIIDELAPDRDDPIVYKTRYSGFFNTELHQVLQEFGIRTLIFTGCTTSVCVESTLRDAFFRDYHCILLDDCVGEPVGHGMARSNHDATLLVVSVCFGWVARSDALIGVLDNLVAAGTSEP
jgi:ureidoacrylate peracid hydrolase